MRGREGKWGDGDILPSRLAGLGECGSFPSGVRGRTPAENKTGAFHTRETAFGKYNFIEKLPIVSLSYSSGVKILLRDKIPDFHLSGFREIVNRRLHQKSGRLGSRVDSMLDSFAEGPEFKSQSRRCRVTVLGKLFTPIVSSPSSETGSSPIKGCGGNCRPDGK